MTGELVLDTGSGYDNALIVGCTLHRVRASTGSGSNGLIVMHTTAADATSYWAPMPICSAFTIPRPLFAVGFEAVGGGIARQVQVVVAVAEQG